MARIASEAKGGYFPTPSSQVSLICNRLAVEQGAKINLFDPCAGEGKALHQMAKSLRLKGAVTETYGCELEKDRAKKAEAILDHAVASSYEELVMTSNAISIIFLNPPYQQGDGERLEVTFLRDLTQTRLQPGGLLIFIIPQSVLSDTALLLANRFRDISVYRFDDSEYYTFRQVVVFGYRREKSVEDKDIKNVRDWLKAVSKQPPYRIPTLFHDDNVMFDIPAAKKEVETFRSERIDPEIIRKEIEVSTLYGKVEDLLMPPAVRNRHNVKMEMPILPISIAQYASALAAGAVGGNMGTHLVEGSTREVTEINEYSEDMDLVTTRHVPTINIFCRKGVIKL